MLGKRQPQRLHPTDDETALLDPSAKNQKLSYHIDGKSVGRIREIEGDPPSVAKISLAGKPGEYYRIEVTLRGKVAMCNRLSFIRSIARIISEDKSNGNIARQDYVPVEFYNPDRTITGKSTEQTCRIWIKSSGTLVVCKSGWSETVRENFKTVNPDISVQIIKKDQWFGHIFEADVVILGENLLHDHSSPANRHAYHLHEESIIASLEGDCVMHNDSANEGRLSFHKYCSEVSRGSCSLCYSYQRVIYLHFSKPLKNRPVGRILTDPKACMSATPIRARFSWVVVDSLADEVLGGREVFLVNSLSSIYLSNSRADSNNRATNCDKTVVKFSPMGQKVLKDICSQILVGIECTFDGEPPSFETVYETIWISPSEQERQFSAILEPGSSEVKEYSLIEQHLYGRSLFSSVFTGHFSALRALHKSLLKWIPQLERFAEKTQCFYQRLTLALNELPFDKDWNGINSLMENQLISEGIINRTIHYYMKSADFEDALRYIVPGTNWDLEYSRFVSIDAERRDAEFLCESYELARASVYGTDFRSYIPQCPSYSTKCINVPMSRQLKFISLLTSAVPHESVEIEALFSELSKDYGNLLHDFGTLKSKTLNAYDRASRDNHLSPFEDTQFKALFETWKRVLREFLTEDLSSKNVTPDIGTDFFMYRIPWSFVVSTANKLAGILSDWLNGAAILADDFVIGQSLKECPSCHSDSRGHVWISSVDSLPKCYQCVKHLLKPSNSISCIHTDTVPVEDFCEFEQSSCLTETYGISQSEVAKEYSSNLTTLNLYSSRVILTYCLIKLFQRKQVNAIVVVPSSGSKFRESLEDACDTANVGYSSCLCMRYSCKLNCREPARPHQSPKGDQVIKFATAEFAKGEYYFYTRGLITSELTFQDRPALKDVSVVIFPLAVSAAIENTVMSGILPIDGNHINVIRLEYQSLEDSSPGEE